MRRGLGILKSGQLKGVTTWNTTAVSGPICYATTLPIVGGHLTSLEETAMSYPIMCNPINPATGLPMTDDSYGGFDVGGNPYGFNDTWPHNPWSSADPVW